MLSLVLKARLKNGVSNQLYPHALNATFLSSLLYSHILYFIVARAFALLGDFSHTVVFSNVRGVIPECFWLHFQPTSNSYVHYVSMRLIYAASLNRIAGPAVVTSGQDCPGGQ